MAYRIITNCDCPEARAVFYEDHGTMDAVELAILYADERASAGGCIASATVYGDSGDALLAEVIVAAKCKARATA